MLNIFDKFLYIHKSSLAVNRKTSKLARAELGLENNSFALEAFKVLPNIMPVSLRNI